MLYLTLEPFALIMLEERECSIKIFDEFQHFDFRCELFFAIAEFHDEIIRIDKNNTTIIRFVKESEIVRLNEIVIFQELE
jgi:hypothetical protein